MLYPLLKKALFLLDAETAHDISLSSLEKTKHTPLNRCLAPATVAKPVKQMGLTFRNSVGLAAGLDKNGDYIEGLAKLGFGFLELGTATPKAQPGNPKPRMFRLTDEAAIINRMGFNNKGIDYLVEKVSAAKKDCVLGINIGKNKITDNDKAIDDYLYCMQKAYLVADYITVNISSPNTPGLRELQNQAELNALISTLKQTQSRLNEQHKKYTPLTLKVAPDLTDEQIAQISEILLKHKIDGLIVSNTTIDREAVKHHRYANEAGGLSGKPLLNKANHALAEFAKYIQNEITLIGVGGVHSAENAKTKQQLGADLVQIYTGFIYQGPGLIRECAQAMTTSTGND